MPRVGDVNLTPLEYANSVRDKVAKLSPSRIYTYRYIWKMDDRDSLSVSLFSGSMLDHEKFRDSLRNNEHVVSASAEYVSEFDVNFLLLVETVVKNKENKEVFKS